MSSDKIFMSLAFASGMIFGVVASTPDKKESKRQWIKVEKWGYDEHGQLGKMKQKTYRQKELTGEFDGYYAFECFIK